MATVYLAIQSSFQREVALKIMSPSLSENSEFSERFLREARIVSRLVHPNIVTVHDVGIDKGQHYLSMEYVEGKDLKQRLADLSAEQVFQVVRDVARALDYAGKKGYVHRDVKPENIMLHDLDGRAVLMDFGIARAADAAISMTRTGVALGTPHYMSPEQARGHSVDGRSDLYSLGVLLYYMLMGSVPFEAESPVAIGIKHISAAIPRLPAVLAVYQPLVDKLMAKKPDDRYQTGAELLADIEGIGVAALALWRSQQALGDANDQQRTPLRNETVELETEASDTDHTFVQEVLETTANAVSASAAGPQPDEALHIPREDLEARFTQQRSGSWLIKLVFLLIMVAGAGFYFYDQLLPIIPKPMAELLQNVRHILLPDAVHPSMIAEAKVKPGTEPESIVGSTVTEPLAQRKPPQAGTSEQAEPAINPIDELINRSQQLAELVPEQPARTQELVNLYREVLALDPEHTASIQALADIKEQTLVALASQIEDGEIDTARQGMIPALAWFPELESDERYQQLEQHLQTAVKVNHLLAEAEQYFASDKLIYPAETNARQRYEAVLALMPEHTQAQQGLEKIAERYWVLAQQAQRQQAYQKAQTRVRNGLSIKPRHQKLLTLQKAINTAIGREQTISRLLKEAVNFEQQQRWFGKGENAALRYRAIQNIDPQRKAAGNGLSRILEALYSRLDQLIASKEYDQASTQIQAALFSFPDNDRLLSLLLELESYKPVIENLRLSGEPITDVNALQAEKITVDRTLYVVFNYRNLDRNLDQPTTVLQVRLFDGGRSLQIAATSVVVVGSEGSTQFRIDRPVEGFTGGGYHLDVLLGDQRMFSHAFVIGH